MSEDYQILFEKYNLLCDENKKLKEEIKHLHSLLTLSDGQIPEISEPLKKGSVNKYSSPEDKIVLFRSLFKGREDVFARRWYSKTTDKSGYQPVCENEWDEKLCDKKRYKCSSCPNRKLVALTDKDIYKHLSGKDLYGRDVIGIYPLLQDETCCFLCADFDEANYRRDVIAFKNTCDELNVPAYIERSRSGNGAHVWVFFCEPVSARTARRLGSGILTRAMERADISFKSYDRLFPNQDTMPKGGFGNLIALPLQGMARKNGNSLFVNEEFIPYLDQWAFLSETKRLSCENIEQIADSICKHGDLGELVSDSDEKPWETKKENAVSFFDFPQRIEFVRSNMLYIPTEALSVKAQNHLKRLAAFKNPDFYRSQAMRLPIYNKPRIICTADTYEHYIALPRGCEEALCDLLDSVSVSYSFNDKTNSGIEIQAEFNGTLRDEQKPAADAMMEHNTGILSATTAFGKTVVASYLIGKRKTNTLILVHTQSLMTQWQKSLEQFLTLNVEPPEQGKSRGRKKMWSPIGTLGAGKNTLNGVVDVAVMQSLINGDEVKELVRNYGMIIVDECHHVSAVSFEKILKFADARYVYGLTATPTRQDGHHPILFMQCGPIRYRVDAKSQAEKRSFEHYLIPRFTSFRSTDQDKSIAEIYKDLAESEFRNSYIINDIKEALKNGRTPIVLTERREHVLLLADRLFGECKNIVTLFGTASQKERREKSEQLKGIPDNEPLVIIATGKYVGEGFDFPRLDTLFLALPISWKGKVAQYAGRLHRNFPGKTEVQIYDYVDIHIPMLEKMYQKRLKGYSSIGYKIKISNTTETTPDLIYDTGSFYSVFSQDIATAKKEILIVSPFMRKSRIVQLVKVSSQAILNGVSVTVITRSPESLKDSERQTVMENAELLKGYGCNVIFKPDFHQKFTVIDNRIVWYGSINFLSFGKTEESVMRFSSYDIAGQLIDTVI